jgi:hypothetical protein
MDVNTLWIFVFSGFEDVRGYVKFTGRFVQASYLQR